MQIHLSSMQETEQFGKRLASALFPGSVVAMIGPLGAGKTTLARAIAIELGVDPRHVSSPTFALVHEYDGRMTVYHFDAYRLDAIDDFVKLGVEDYWNSDGVCLVEWADRVISTLPKDRLQIELLLLDDSRQLTMTATGPKHELIVGQL